jgi:hypothetical protein
LKKPKNNRRIKQKFPNNTKSYQLYSKIHTYQNEDNHQKIMLEKIKNQNLNNEDLSNFYFALAKSFFDQKNIENLQNTLLKQMRQNLKHFIIIILI